MLHFISSTTYSVFGLTLQTWGSLVTLGFVIGTYAAWRRAQTKGLNPNAILDLAFWIFIAAFIGARLFHVLFYEPQYYLTHPLEAIDPRKPGFSMFGGLIGSAIATLVYVKYRALNFLAYADALAWGLPWGFGIGRIGCFLTRLHPGTETTFFLGAAYPDGTVRHDLGLYLSIDGFLTGILFLVLNRRPREPGFWVGSYLLIESLVRFGTDFLRVADARYFYLTPAQWLAIPMFFIGFWFLRGQKWFIHRKSS